MEENKDTHNYYEPHVGLATCLFVILHLIVITGWGLTIYYVWYFPRKRAVLVDPAYANGRDILLHHATMETVIYAILTSLFTIILYLEWCRRLPKKE